jgi:putative salt-induced outer membrane protein YdiY
MLRSGLKNRVWWFIILCCLVSTYVRAEKVVLVEGNTIQGEVAKETDSSIILAQKVLGELEIPKDQISSMTVVHDVLGEIEILPDQILSLAAGRPEVETVVLLEGDVIHGEITKKTDSTIILVHEVFGKLEIPKDQIASITIVHDVLGGITIRSDRTTSTGTGEPKAESPEVKIPSGKKGTPQRTEEKEDIWFEPEFERLNALVSGLKKRKWSLALNFSIDTVSGEDEESTTRFGAHVKRKLPRERLAIDLSYYNKVSYGDVTDNKLTVGGVQDWLNPGSRWFFFGAGRYDFDEFESWNQRANLQAGPGYNLIKSDDKLLNLRFGAGGRKEWGSLNNDLKFEGLTGVDFTWELTEKQTFDSSVWYFPVLTGTEDYRTRSTLNWRYQLSKELNLSLLLGLLHEYQSIVDPGRENSETRTYVGLQMEF